MSNNKYVAHIAKIRYQRIENISHGVLCRHRLGLKTLEQERRISLASGLTFHSYFHGHL